MNHGAANDSNHGPVVCHCGARFPHSRAFREHVDEMRAPERAALMRAVRHMPIDRLRAVADAARVPEWMLRRFVCGFTLGADEELRIIAAITAAIETLENESP